MIDYSNDPPSLIGQVVHSEDFEVEPALVALTELITRRLQSGETVVDDDFAKRFPEWVDFLQSMLPTIRELLELGRSVAHGPRPSAADFAYPIPRSEP